MTIFSLYFPLLLSLSLSFLFHIIINSFKEHIHSFMALATAFNATNNATDNHKCRHHPISSTAITRVKVSPPSPVGLGDDIGGGVDGFMCCTESLGFESIDERRVDDHVDEIHYNNDNEDDDGRCSWRRRMRVAEGRGNWREVKSFPPPLSSLNRNGQPSFFLLPVRKNGRLKLTKVRMKRPEILYASRQDGRLRMYLVPDQCIVDDVEEEDEEEEQELVGEVAEQQEEEIMVESDDKEEEEEDEVVEEIRDENEEDRVGEWKFPGMGNEGFRRCHQVANQCYHVHGCYHHLHMYGVGIA